MTNKGRPNQKTQKTNRKKKDDDDDEEQKKTVPLDIFMCETELGIP
ncbi:hypothetical protein TorRG33x02_142010 [Trema orientale]|uniref:Uncharacterized protein n=1 Tax=Trema orientale TaxID=63057 RepID=A0A2P5EWL2_TREOI|nr:hypothetical protein TorRG33x02_142010 [Trema orientale]